MMTYRLTEHHTAGGMSQTLSHLAGVIPLTIAQALRLTEPSIHPTRLVAELQQFLSPEVTDESQSPGRKLCVSITTQYSALRYPCQVSLAGTACIGCSNPSFPMRNKKGLQRSAEVINAALSRLSLKESGRRIA
jgi:hypothetical protein